MEIYVAAILMSVSAMLVLISLVAQNSALSKEVKAGILLSSAMTIIGASAECLGVLLNGSDGVFRVPHMIVKFVELSITPIIPVAFAAAFNRTRSVRFLSVPILVHAVIEFLSIFFGIVFYVDADNIYHHCKFYGIYYAMNFMGIVFLIVQVMRFSKRFQSRNKLSLFLVMLFLLSGILSQAIESSLKIVWATISVAEILFYIYYCDLVQQIDSLTELLNRRIYEIRIEKEKRRVGILFLDIDGFKSINDTYGHPFGDTCLAIIGKAMKEAYGKVGLCYRIGGDEFCVIFERDIDFPETWNSKFNDILAQKRQQESRLPGVTMGYAVFEPETMRISEAVACADKKMYQMKEKNIQTNEFRAEAER